MDECKPLPLAVAHALALCGPARSPFPMYRDASYPASVAPCLSSNAAIASLPRNAASTIQGRVNTVRHVVHCVVYRCSPYHPPHSEPVLAKLSAA